MSVTAESPADHLVLYGVSWETYTGVVIAFGERRLRHSYDEGTLEMMSPLKYHEWVKKMIGRLIDVCTLELDMQVQSIGSTTLGSEKAQKGLEPDDCYYISHEREVRGLSDYDPDRNPPPDLAIEVDATHKSLNRMEIYEALGVPELWRATKDGMVFYRLNRSGRYSKIPRSRELPLFTPALIDEYLALRNTKSETAIIRQFVAWVRSTQQKKKK
ncbi:MAG TPA: Uma2 family endonuclease [Pirellulales bacterium]|jgi:Uma2 family endonuclease|nr:Uma2 family endonuclease [Pirellulales bacterium]